MAVTSTWTVVRDILSADMTLTADQVIARAKAKGVKAPVDAIRTTVHTLRKRLKKKISAPAAQKPTPAAAASPPSKPAAAAKPPAAAKPATATKAASAPKPVPAPKPVAAAARQTAVTAPKAGPSAAPVVRAILSAAPNLPADAVIARAKAKGVTAPEESIRNAVHNIRSELKRAAVKTAKPAQAVAGPPAPPAASTATPTPGGAVAGVLANVAQVHAAVSVCGGVEHARQVAEAVRACGGAEAFGMYLDLVAGIRAPGTGA